MLVRINDKKLYQGKPIVGLALSGGGVRGATHIGVLKALSKNHIPIDMISGTSAGSIVAAMYACGYSPESMQQIAENLKFNDLFDLKIKVSSLIKYGFKWLLFRKYTFWSLLPCGLIKGNKFENFFKKLWGSRTVRDVNIPLAITAVDINSADTVFFTTPLPNRRAILNAKYHYDATLSDAVRASISIPGILLPKKYNNMTLVDGAVKNNLPTDILHHMGANIIIAVDLGYSGHPNYNIDTIGEVLMQCLDILGREITLLKAEQHADIIIRPDIADISFKDLRHIKHCIHRGEKFANTKISEIKQLIASYGNPDNS